MMRVLLIAGVVTLLGGLPPGGVAWAQQGGDTADGPLVDPSTPRLSAEDLQELVAPIALYPDTLLASMLAACVYPDDVKAAAAHVAAGKALDDAAAGEWDPAVVTVAGVSEALKTLTDYPEWTESVGQAFLAQGADVMSAVQALRARAWANGALQSTPQQTVVARENTIVAWPDRYGVDGRSVFLVSADGRVFERDFGDAAGADATTPPVDTFDPTPDWTRYPTGR